MLDVNALAKLFETAKRDPLAVIEAIDGSTHYSKQYHISNLILKDGYKGRLGANPPMIAVQSANSTGKSRLIPDIARGWLLKYPNNSSVIVVAPGEQVLKNTSFKYLARCVQNDARRENIFGQLGFKQTHLKYAASSNWYMEGRIANKPESLQGEHEGNLLVIIDEASGIEPWVMDVIDGWTINAEQSGARVVIVMFGNPLRLVGPYYDAFHSQINEWETVKISAYDTPGLSGEAEGNPELEKIVKFFPSKDRIERLKRKWEKSGNMAKYMQRVMGEFSAAGGKSIIDPQKLLEARERIISMSDERVIWSKPQFGLDVAREGEDSNMLYLSEGPKIQHIDAWGQCDTMQTAYRALDNIEREYQRMKEHKGRHGNNLRRSDVIVMVDIVGLGSGPFDRMREEASDRGWEYTIRPFDARRTPITDEGKKEHPNRKAEAWYGFAESLYEEEWDIPDDPQLARELLSAEKKYNKRGRDVEEKATIKKKLGQSPDRADALIMATAPYDDIYEPFAN